MTGLASPSTSTCLAGKKFESTLRLIPITQKINQREYNGVRASRELAFSWMEIFNA